MVRACILLYSIRSMNACILSSLLLRAIYFIIDIFLSSQDIHLFILVCFRADEPYDLEPQSCFSSLLCIIKSQARTLHPTTRLYETQFDWAWLESFVGFSSRLLPLSNGAAAPHSLILQIIYPINCDVVFDFINMLLRIVSEITAGM